MTEFADRDSSEQAMLSAVHPLMLDLLRYDDWLPSAYSMPDETHYRQYLLHCDPKERFSIVSFVWGPGQRTPIHNHTIWGLLGVLRGSEKSQRFILGDGEMVKQGATDILESGAIDFVSPNLGDIHQVQNGSLNKPSVSIHVYGGNIGRVHRHAFDHNGVSKTFVSGYSADVLPNLWGKSPED